LLVFSITVWFANWEAIVWMFQQSHVGLSEKFGFLFSYYGSIQTNFSALSAVATVIISILFGLTVTLFAYYVQRMRGIGDAESVGATSIGGLVSGFFGIGCASCGSVLATAILAQFGAGALLLYLPLGGQEFSLIAIVLLGYSSYALTKKIRSPLVCEIG
jgi:hypothetical protein